MEDLHDGCFSGIVGLSFLDLSHNKARNNPKLDSICNVFFQLAFVGSIFEDLVSQDLTVDLSNNLINDVLGMTVSFKKKTNNASVIIRN